MLELCRFILSTLLLLNYKVMNVWLVIIKIQSDSVGNSVLQIYIFKSPVVHPAGNIRFLIVELISLISFAIPLVLPCECRDAKKNKDSMSLPLLGHFVTRRTQLHSYLHSPLFRRFRPC